MIASADLASARLRVPAHLTQAQFRYDHEMFSLLPATISYGSPEDSFHLEAIAGAGQREFPVYHLSGNLRQARDLVSTAGALGWNISRGWDVAGPVRCDLHWQGARFPWQTQPIGTIEWGGESSGASLLTPFLNQPVKQIRARAEFKAGLAAHCADFGGGFRRALDVARSIAAMIGKTPPPGRGNSRYPPTRFRWWTSIAGSIRAGGKAFWTACCLS